MKCVTQNQRSLIRLAFLLTLTTLSGSFAWKVFAEPDTGVESLPLRQSVAAPEGSPAPVKLGLTLHVSPNGNDTGDGSDARPFGSLERARDEIRARRRAHSLPVGQIQVLVHGGEYSVHHTFVLGEADSGSESAPVVFRAADAEKPVFRGGAVLKGWRPLSSEDHYPELPEAAREHVWILDLQAESITNLLPLKLGGFASGNGFRTHPAHELFFNGAAMQLARGPNDGFLHIKELAVKDGTKGYDREGSKVGRFSVETDRLSRWAKEPDLLLYGYWFWDWADSYERVASIDPEKKLITLAQPWHSYGFSAGAPFYAINALSELDLPGEWYLDRAHGRVLFYPPSDPQQAKTELSLLPVPMLQLENVNWVRFTGLTFELGSADAIHVSHAKDVSFAGCVIRRFAGTAVEIDDGRRVGLRSCDIYSMGRGGVDLSGGNRKTLEPGECFLNNCDIHDLSRIDHTYTPAVSLSGVGNRITHNRFHDIRSSAMRVGGNDHQVEYNEIFNAVTESDDQGGADMFGNPTFRGNVYRFNYWHHLGNWRGSGEQPKCGQAGIRLDDAISGTQIVGNVFERCSAGKLGFGGVQIHGGKENVVENNLFIQCSAMISCSPWSDDRWRDFVAKALDSPEIDRALYLKRYPELAELSEHANRNVIRRNVGWRCGELLRRAPQNIDSSGNTLLSDTQFEWNPKQFRFRQPGFDPIPFDQIGLYRDPPYRLQ